MDPRAKGYIGKPDGLNTGRMNDGILEEGGNQFRRPPTGLFLKRAFFPGAPYGKRLAEITVTATLDVEEERFSVRAKRSSGQFAIIVAVEGQVKQLSIWS